MRSEPGGQHPLDHQNAFGDHQTLAARQVRPPVDAVEVPEVVDPWIVGVGDVDDLSSRWSHGDKVAAMTSDSIEPPQLRAALTDPRRVIVVGALLWALVAVAAFTVPALESWRPITVAGLGVGVVGVSIFLWQRSAARRGSRGAQTGIEPKDPINP